MTKREVWELCKKLYTMPWCGAGGPCHIVLDDGNLRDDCIKQCLWWLDQYDSAFTKDWPDEVKELSRVILTEMLNLSMTQRNWIVNNL